MRALLIAAVLLVGCDNAPAAPASDAPAAEPARVEAEKACAAITGYRPGNSDKVLATEFAACVAAVGEDESPAEAEPVPGLRGRTEG